MVEKQSFEKKYPQLESSCDQSELKCSKIKQFLPAILATLGAFSAGLCLSWSSPAGPLLRAGVTGVTITKTQASWISSLVNLGAFLGAIPAGMITSIIGRKKSLQLVSIPLFVSWILIAYGTYAPFFYAARVIAGFCIGVVSVAAPMYVAELSHKSIRGTLGTFFQVQITMGVLLEFIFGSVLNFKWLALTSSAVPLIFLLAFSFMPESHVFLYRKGEIESAVQSLQWFRGKKYDIRDEVKQVSDQLKEDEVGKTSFRDLFCDRATIKALIISLGLMIFQQLSGINAVLFYAGEIFSESGSSIDPAICTIIIGTTQVIATLLSTVLIDKLGRKILLLISSLVMCICLASLGSYFYLKQSHDLSFLSTLPLISLGVFIVVFSIGFGPIPWLMVGELFTPKVKGLAGSIGAAFNWFLAFIVTNQFENLSDVLGRGITFIIFACICLLGFIFVLFVVPETKGKDLKEVQNILMGIENASECDPDFVISS